MISLRIGKITHRNYSLATRLQIRGCAGIVTDGGLRDADDIAALEMPSFCANPSAPTNLTKHQALDLNVPIGCGSVAVFPGDIAVGDGDGVIILPAELATVQTRTNSRPQTVHRREINQLLVL